MAVINRIAGFSDEMAQWRQHIHANPELGFDCFETSAFIAEKLRAFGVNDIYTGIAKTGIVAVIEGVKPGPTIGLRADMDALPMSESTGHDYASRVAGKMHACGHDGHVTMLLGAAKYLAETRNFAGRVALIFQPAEEGGGGAGVMVDEGIIERFAIDQIYGLHTHPGLEAGHFVTTDGPLLAAVDRFDIHIRATGGHGAAPHLTNDPIIAATSLVQAIQTIVSRNHQGTKDLVVSVTQIHSGSADNIIPDYAYINGTVRTYDKAVQDMVKTRLETLAAGIAQGFDVTIEVDYQYGYPATINDAQAAQFAVDIANEVSEGRGSIDPEIKEMGAEDFSYYLQKRPGAFLNIGQGIGPGLHQPDFDFNDEVAPMGASFFARLVERALPLA